jgi:hypothetical protein
VQLRLRSWGPDGLNRVAGNEAQGSSSTVWS